ncbi:MAG: ATP-binding cassette domain-containing protein [Paracoccaceae bacterium]
MYDDCRASQGFLRVSDLVLEANGRRLIDIPELSLSHQGATVVMGPNGAGKSVLLRLLHGLDPPTSGQIELHTPRRAQALVFQTPVLLRRSAEANLRFVCKVRNLDCSVVPVLLDQVGLAGKAQTPARRLSGGERQRLAIAQALATKPDVLLLDEPTASLDPAATRLIERILQPIISNGVRVLLVTHDAMQARRLADDVVFLSEGQVREHRPAAEFFETPKSAAARAYLEGRLLT